MLSEFAKAYLKKRAIDPDTALGLGVVSLSRSGGIEELEFPRIRGTEVLGRAYRRIDIPKEGERNVFRQEAGGEKMLFNENGLNDARFSGAVVLTEGEFDTIAAVQSGWDRAASVPDGAPGSEVDPQSDSAKWSYVPRLLDILKDERDIVLAFDGDAPGQNLRAYMQARLGKARCRFVEYPPGCKDLNDVLRRLGPEAVTRAIKAAKPVKVPGVVKLRDLPTPHERPVWRAGLSSDFDRAIGFVPGHISVWTGLPGDGKSLIMRNVCIELGRKLGLVSAVAAFEDDLKLDYRSDVAIYLAGKPRKELTDADWAKADAFLDESFVFIAEDEDEREPMTLDWLLDRMEVCAIRHGARFFVIDPWTKVEHDFGVAEGEHRYTGKALNTLIRFARKFDAHVAIVAHPRKIETNKDGKTRPPFAHDISGSSHFFNLTYLGVTVFRDRDLGAGASVIIPWKIKRQPEMGVQKRATLHVDQATGRVEDYYAHGGVEP